MRRRLIKKLWWWFWAWTKIFEFENFVTVNRRWEIVFICVRLGEAFQIACARHALHLELKKKIINQINNTHWVFFNLGNIRRVPKFSINDLKCFQVLEHFWRKIFSRNTNTTINLTFIRRLNRQLKFNEWLEVLLSMDREHVCSLLIACKHNLKENLLNRKLPLTWLLYSKGWIGSQLSTRNTKPTGKPR